MIHRHHHIRHFLLLVLVSLSVFCGGVSYASAAEISSSEAEDRLFSAVFADPTNLVLNFKLAGAQLANGNIKGAIGTLERILTLSPGNNQAQILLAEANLRTGNTTEGRRMLSIVVANPKATQAERGRAQDILARLDSISERFVISSVLLISNGISDNPEGGSVSNLAEIGPSGSINGGFSKRANHESFLTVSGNVSLVMKLESQREESVTFGFSGLRKDFTNYDEGDLTILGVNSRYSRALERGVVNTALGIDRIDVNDKHHLDSYTASVGYSETFLGRWTGDIGLTIGRNVFKKRGASAAGEKTSKSGGINLRLVRSFEDFQLGGKYGYSRSHARVASESKKTHSGGVFVSSNFFSGISSVSYDISQVSFAAPDVAYNADEVRRDKTHSIGVNYLLGLSSLDVPRGTESRLSFAAKYGKSKSTIANFTKYSGEISLTLIKPF